MKKFIQVSIVGLSLTIKGCGIAYLSPAGLLNSSSADKVAITKLEKAASIS